MLSKIYFVITFGGRQTKGDILCEMRFHVPNNEVDKYFTDKEKDGKIEDEDEDEEEITAANLFKDKIVKKANIG